MKKYFLIKKLYQFIFFISILLSFSNLNTFACKYTFTVSLTGGTPTATCLFKDTSAGSAQSCAETTNRGSNNTLFPNNVFFCSSENKIATCPISANNLSYDAVFNKTYNTGTGKFEYTILKAGTGCILSNLATPNPIPNPPPGGINIVQGCNISSSSNPGDSCQIPSDCYESSSQPILFNKVGSIQGGLYCISTQTDPKKGTVYFCPNLEIPYPAVNRPYRYVEITDLVVSGTDKIVKLKTGNTNCTTLFANTKLKVKIPVDYSPVGLLKTISNFLFYVAILYFVLLMLSNGYAYVRAAEDPGKLKEIKASLFNTIAGFLFVLLSGGLIISLINSIGL
jgi:hypothetical protein